MEVNKNISVRHQPKTHRIEVELRANNHTPAYDYAIRSMSVEQALLLYGFLGQVLGIELEKEVD